MSIKLLIAAIALAGIGTPALADMPGKGWISSAKVKNILAKRGYRVTKLEADDGHWEGEATKANIKFEFHVDPRSGAITKMERDHS
ncbi:PepSY domain-containing protein [Sphingomonas sp. RP10(2022)]|uniref:PepSY domain-containing protein n=1 Tax=Sphingomonas liriopis TaxID=2949094 RepID=A0A9X2KSM2_9SPHN|nr:PepSY domain-containing protein [Sphingomonas liriopis]MCP3733963.1 PepSY domain-containing protein [Sphingomonas liriopis]